MKTPWTTPFARNIRAKFCSPGSAKRGRSGCWAASAVVAGCGAIGAAAANLLVRAGVGRVRVIDRDFVEPSNLQRQTLFEEADARDALPKAVAAERRLRRKFAVCASKASSRI